MQMKLLKLLRLLSLFLSLSTSALVVVVVCLVAGNYSASDGSLGRIETVMLLVLQSQDKQVGSTASGSTATPRHGLVSAPSLSLLLSLSPFHALSPSPSPSSHLC